MSDAAPKITTVGSTDELPGGLLPQEGESVDEATQGLFDALGSDEEFAEETEDDSSPTGDKPEGEDSGSEESEDDGDEDSEEDLDDDGDDDEDESDEDGDEGEGSEQELSGDTIIKGVPLPGGETTEVTLDELKLGYSRTQDYTRKRQRDAEEHGNAMAEVREVRDQYKDTLSQVSDVLTRLGPQKPDAALRAENPGEYAAQMADYQAFQDSLASVSSETGAISEEEQREIQQAQQAHVQQEWEKLTAAVPAWQDQAVATQELTKLRQFAIEEFGFSAQEIDSVTDSRLLLMLKKSHDLQSQTSEAAAAVESKKAKAKERLAPGGRKTKASAKSRKRKAQRNADKRATTTGNVMDAARAIELALGDD